MARARTAAVAEPVIESTRVASARPDRIARLCRGSSKDADKRVRVSRVFKAVVAGLSAAAAAELAVAG
jgi:hypothetical protein